MAKKNKPQAKNIRLYNRTRKTVRELLAKPGWTQARILKSTTIKGATLSRIFQGQHVARKATLEHVATQMRNLVDFPVPVAKKDKVPPKAIKRTTPGKVHREIFALLERRWSELGGYAIGWNDKRVALSVVSTLRVPAGFVSEQTVLQIREEAFGPIEGTAVAALETKLAELETLVVALTKDIAKLRGKR